MNKIEKKGFTLIELLIVIAIIGILASVVLVSLSGARGKARAASFKSSVSSIVASAVMCGDANPANTLNDPAADAGGAICTDASVTGAYPDLTQPCGGGWDYDPSADNDLSDGTFSFTVSCPSITASLPADDVAVCTETGCIYN